MEVAFATVELQRAYQDAKVRTKLWGARVGGLYARRVDALYAAPSAQDLRVARSLRFHALKGNRKGQCAINIDESYRLILRFENDQMTIVRIEEVSNHYDD